MGDASWLQRSADLEGAARKTLVTTPNSDVIYAMSYVDLYCKVRQALEAYATMGTTTFAKWPVCLRIFAYLKITLEPPSSPL
jgi:hypothetical protein